MTPQQQHCDHEKMCYRYREYIYQKPGDPCIYNPCPLTEDTRASRPAPLTQTQSPNIAKAISELEYSLSADPLEEIDYHIREAINLLKEVSP